MTEDTINKKEADKRPWHLIPHNLEKQFWERAVREMEGATLMGTTGNGKKGKIGKGKITSGWRCGGRR